MLKSNDRIASALSFGDDCLYFYGYKAEHGVQLSLLSLELVFDRVRSGAHVGMHTFNVRRPRQIYKMQPWPSLPITNILADKFLIDGAKGSSRACVVSPSVSLKICGTVIGSSK